MSLIKDVAGAVCVAAGAMLLGGALFLGATAQAAVKPVPGPIETAGECAYYTGRCNDDSCTKTCPATTDRDKCKC